MTDPSLLAEMQQTAYLAALRAGEVVRRHYMRPGHIRQKRGPRDLVTDTDHAAQAAALEVIRERHPDHHILAEENPQGRPDERGVWPIPPGAAWIVDPLDGTTNYTTGLPMVCVSVGVAVDGEPLAGAIYDPLRREMFLAAQGLGATLNGRPLKPLHPVPLAHAIISVDWSHAPGTRERMVQTVLALSRRCRTLRALGSAALGLAYVACGRVQLYANYGLQPWDAAAAAVLIREAGGDLRRPDGSAWRLGEPWVFAGHPEVVAHALEALPAHNGL